MATPDRRYAREPFGEALTYLRDKINLDTDSWRDLRDDEHDAFFVVAGAKGSLLSELRTAVDQAIERGTRPEDFQATFEKIAEGWDYNGSAGWRSRTILQTNLRASYGRGREELQLDPEVLRLQPYLQYIHGGSGNPRPHHLALDGQVFTSDTLPWALPSGYGCSCRYASLSSRRLTELGLSPSTLKRGDSVDVLMPDGRTVRTPLRPDDGWDRQPGQARGARRDELIQRVIDRSPPEIARQIRADVAAYRPPAQAVPPPPRQNQDYFDKWADAFEATPPGLRDAITDAPYPGEIPLDPKKGAYQYDGNIHMGTETPGVGTSAAVWRHEYGHHLDQHLGKMNGGAGSPIGFISSSPDGSRAMNADMATLNKLKADFDATDYKQRREFGMGAVLASQNPDEYNRILAAAPPVFREIDRALDGATSPTARETIAHAILSRHPESFVSLAERAMARSYEGERTCMAADLAGAITLNNVGEGHSNDYYKKPGFRETEAFANVFSLAASGDPLELEVARHIAPSFSQFVFDTLGDPNGR